MAASAASAALNSALQYERIRVRVIPSHSIIPRMIAAVHSHAALHICNPYRTMSFLHQPIEASSLGLFGCGKGLPCVTAGFRRTPMCYRSETIVVNGYFQDDGLPRAFQMLRCYPTERRGALGMAALLGASFWSWAWSMLGLTTTHLGRNSMQC